MVWTVPKTAADGETLNAAEYNMYVRDNLLETHAAKATSGNRGAWFCGTGPNAGAERMCAENEVLTSQSSSSTSYVNLSTVGPTVTVNTGERALVFLYCFHDNSLSNWSSYMSYAVSGATTVAASDDTALRRQGNTNMQDMTVHLAMGLTPGSNTFQAKYRVAGGTGTWAVRRLIVMPF